MVSFAYIDVLSIRFKNRSAILCFFCFFIFLLAGLRSRGYDYGSYEKLFGDIRNNSLSAEGDLGFYGLCYVSSSYRILLLAMSFLTITPFFLVLKKHSFFPFVSILIFSTTLLYPTVMGQMRQGVALFIMLFAYNYRDKKAVFIMLFLSALLFHSSAIICLLYLIPIKRLFSYWKYLLAIYLSIRINPLIKSQISDLFSVDTDMINKIAEYNELETEQNIEIGFNTSTLIRLIVFSVCYYYAKKKNSQIQTQMLNLYFLSMVIYLSLGFIPQLGGRGALYFSIFDLLLIPQILNTASKRNRIVISSFFIALSIARFIMFFNDSFNSSMYVPYFN